MSLISRVQNILLKPKEEWGVIDAEPATVQGIFTSYVMILAAIGPICSVIGQSVIGVYGIKFPLSYSIASAAITYVMSLVVVFVSALIIDALAPTFNGTKDSVKALKVAAYSSTAGWICGIFNIIPMLGILALIGALYGLYLFYLGLPRLMRVSDDKAIGYVVLVIVVQIVLYFVVAMVVAALVATFFGSMLLAGAGAMRLN